MSNESRFQKIGSFLIRVASLFRQGHRHVWNYHQITETVYLGSQLQTQGDLKRLLEMGVEAIIDMQAERRPILPPKTTLSAGAPLPNPSLKYYLWLPTVDGTSPSLDHLLTGVKFLHDMSSQGIKTYVHCHAGAGRSPTLVAAYLISCGMGVEEACDWVAYKRFGANPKSNLDTLREFERLWRERYGPSQEMRSSAADHREGVC